MLNRLSIILFIFIAKTTFASDGQYVVNYQNCAEELCGDVSENLLTSMANERLTNVNDKSDFIIFQPKVEKFLKERRDQNIINIKKTIEIFSGNKVNHKIMSDFVLNLVEQGRFENSKFQLPSFYSEFRERAPSLISSIEESNRKEFEVENVCKSKECQKEVIMFFLSRGIKDNLSSALSGTQNINNFEHLSLKCRPNWNKDAFFEGEQEEIGKYEKGLDRALGEFESFANSMGINFSEPLRAELMNVSYGSLDEFKNKIINGEGGSELFQKQTSLLSLLDWTLAGGKYNPEGDLLFQAECSEYDFTSFSFATGDEIVISNRDATISAKSDSYGVLFHEAGHILEEMINSSYENVDFPCQFTEIVDITNSIFNDKQDREQYFSETVADIVSILLTQENKKLTYCRMLEIQATDGDYKPVSLFPNDEHLGALARILIEAKMKKIDLPKSCQNLMKKNNRINFDSI